MRGAVPAGLGARVPGGLALGAWLVLAALAPAALGQPATEHPEAALVTAPVVVDGAALFRVRGVTAFPAETRAAAIAGRIEALARDPGVATGSLRLVEEAAGTRIAAGDRLVMVVTDADGRVEGVERGTLAVAYLVRVREAIETYREARAGPALRRGLLRSLVATAVATVAAAVVLLGARRLRGLVEARYRARVEAMEDRAFHLVRREHVWSAVTVLLTLSTAVAVLAGIVFYVDFVLHQFPWTRPLAAGLAAVLVRPLATMARGVAAEIPNLVFLAVLVLVVRYVLRLFRAAFEALGRGSLALPGFDPDWALSTYRLVRLAVVAFALVVAYPYIPGSGSEAFKGVSLFLGVVFSLGSSSAISNIIAGYTLTYRRAFKVGDRVKIEDVTGDVTAIRLQVTHLRTVKNEEAIVPNSTILGTTVINYSALARSHGLILHTTVGIGYETPWRQVEAMLIEAAKRTPGLLAAPPPFVLLRSLGDFCVTYELNVYSETAQAMGALYTALHRNVLDVFNEYGVQIMTPAYEGDPPEPKVVPPERWYAAPAPSRPQA